MKLLGKRIVLDPGHGQGATGAIGRGGTLECEVNIRVTRHLQGLLQRAGATVWVTWDVLDHWTLENRAHLAPRLGADLFVSVHHNATEPPDPLRNRIEVYYPWDNLPEARDLAWFIGQALQEYSGFFLAPPMPARYRVLRENVPLSVLLEPGYLSNREVERLLADRRYQLGEAEAIFQGILRFFEAREPRVRRVVAFPGGVRVRLEEPVAGEVVVWHHGREQASRALEGRETRVWVPYRLPAGRHTLRVEVRPARGRSVSREAQVRVERRAVRVRRLRRIQGPGLAALELEYLDYLGEPVRPEVQVPDGVEHRWIGTRAWLFVFRALELRPRFEEARVVWEPGPGYRLAPEPGRAVRLEDPRGRGINEVPDLDPPVAGVQVFPGYVGVAEEAGLPVTLRFRKYRPQELKAPVPGVIVLQPKPLAGKRVVVLLMDRCDAWRTGVRLARQQLERDWGVEMVVLEPHQVHHHGHRLVNEVEALQPDAIVLLDTYYRWPRGVYAYYRSKPSRALADALARAAAATGSPLTARTGSNYFLIQANPPRAQINGVVSAADLATLLTEGLVSFLRSQSG